MKAIELIKRFPTLTPPERKALLRKRDPALRKTLLTLMARLLKSLYSDRYERVAKRKCIWRWATNMDQHWRELAKNLIELEQDPEKFMEFSWCSMPMNCKHPPLNWMKSPLTVERSLAWSPADSHQGVNWHESRDYQRLIHKAQADEAKAELAQREWNASRHR